MGPGRSQPLAGAEGYREPTEPTAAHLASRYGSAAPEVLALSRVEQHLGEPMVQGLPYTKAEAVYAARSEMSVTLDDVLSRRTRARLFDRPATVAAAADVARLIAADMDWDDAEVERQVVEFRNSCATEQTAGETAEADLLGVHR